MSVHASIVIVLMAAALPALAGTSYLRILQPIDKPQNFETVERPCSHVSSISCWNIDMISVDMGLEIFNRVIFTEISMT